MLRAHEWFRFVAIGGLVAYGCSLTSSLDDLTANSGRDAGLETGGTVGGDSGGGKGGGGATDSMGASGGSSASGGTGGVGGGDAQTDAKDPCALTDNCPSCCASTHQSGAKVQLDAILECVCSDAGFCATSCETYCQNGVLDLQCNNCIGTAEVQTCLQAKCSVSPDCEIYVACKADCSM